MALTFKITQHTYSGIGRCIYGTDHEPADSEEHIIPFALHGRMVLPDASCPACREATGAFAEGPVLRDNFGALLHRMRSAFPPRRGAGRLQKIINGPNKPIRVLFPLGESGWQKGFLPAREIPRRVLLPDFSAPGILKGTSGKQISEFGAWISHALKDHQQFEARYPGTKFEQRLAIDLYARMVAKIAHSFAYAEIETADLETYELFLPAIILGANKAWPQYVGGTYGPNRKSIPAASQWLHDVSLEEAASPEFEVLVARVRLFAGLGAPTSIAVVGRRKRGLHPSPRLRSTSVARSA